MNAPVTTDTHLDRTAPLTLWRAAGAFMHILHALFGAPEHVAAKHTLLLKAHQLMASWLRCGEAMMRRLLLIEAAAFAKPNTRPLLREPRKRTRKLMGFSPDKPEEWRVSFRCMERPRPRVPDNGAFSRARTPALHRRRRLTREERWCSDHWPRPKFRSAWPLAERYEALLRVFNDPIAYARRLARRLHATPHRLRELLRAPPEAAHRVDRFEPLTAAAEAKMFNSG